VVRRFLALAALAACKSPFPYYCDVDTPCADAWFGNGVD
jgi:hypothetical protein